jgi:hypothetical protein
MKSIPAARILPRGRITKWSKEQLDKLSTLELRALLANAERLKEPEVAALCNELLDSRPHGHPAASPRKRAARRLVARNKAFALNGVAPRSRIWSRGGTRTDGTVLLMMAADEVQRAGGSHSCLLWAPNVGAARPWSDSPGGKERLDHCRTALGGGTAHGLLMHGKPGAAECVDTETLLQLQVEQRGDEYWATWTAPAAVVNTFE